MTDAAHTNAPIPFTQILDEALKLSRRHLKSILLPISIPVAGAAGLMTLSQGFMYLSMPMGGDPDGAIPDFRNMLGAGIGVFVAVLLFFVVTIWGHLALLVATTEVVAGRPVSMSRAWLFPIRLPALGTTMLWWLALVIGFVLCCVPGLYVWMIFGLFVPVMVLESRFGPDALRRSTSLTTYNPTGAFTADPRVKIFVVGAVSWLVGMALSIVVQMPMMIVQQVYMFHAMSSGGDKNPGEMMAKMIWLQVPSQMLGAAIQLLTQLYMAFGVALLYFDCRNRKEGTDLEKALADLDGGAPEGTAG
jgi:hypothetical protein